MGQSASSEKAHPPSTSPSQLANILESIPLEIWLQILRVMDLKTLVLVSSICAFSRQLYTDNQLGIFYRSHRKPIHIPETLKVSTEPGEPQSPQTDASAPPKQQILFPKVLIINPPCEIPQNLSFDQASFVIIQGSDESNRKEVPLGKLFRLLENFPKLEHVSMSKIFLDGVDPSCFSNLNMESLYLQSCHINPYDPYSLCWALIEGLKKLRITVSPTDHISAFLQNP